MHDLASKNAKRPNILMVDDDPMYIDIYATKLRSSGYDIIVSQDGKEAFHLARTERPDAILLDIMMPHMGGQELLVALKADDATKDIPVIMLSILNQGSEVDAAMEHGAACYLVKSDLTPQQIMDELQRCMK